MGLRNEIAQYKAWKDGVVHTTLNPEGPGAVRIHLVPPKWKLWGSRAYVVILNGYYILPLGYSWAVLLRQFIREINVYQSQPMSPKDMELVIQKAVHRAGKIYRAPKHQMEEDLHDMLQTFCQVARGETPSGDIPAMSLRAYASHMSAPHRMDLMISAMTTPDGTWNCNLKCRHCYAAGQPGAIGKELSTAEWKKIIDKCREAHIPQLTFTGGEPTVRKDLVELIGHARWFVTRLNTNGVLLTPQLCEELQKASLDSVQITLYSSDPAIHNRLVGSGLADTSGSWEKTVTGLRNALEAGLDVSVNTPLCRENADYVSTLQFLCGEGVGYVSCSGLIETGNASGDATASVQLTLDEMGEILIKAAAYVSLQEMELQFTSPGRARASLLRELGMSVPICGACLSNMAITPDGTVVPCQSWLSDGRSLGSMIDDSWKNIWNRLECRNIRAMSEEESLLCPLRSEKQRGGAV